MTRHQCTMTGPSKGGPIPAGRLWSRSLRAGRDAFARGLTLPRAIDGYAYAAGWRAACADTARAMLDELDTQRLEVAVIVPPGALCGVRKAVEVNLDWYRDLCAAWPRVRRGRRRRRAAHRIAGDTLVKRAHVRRALGELAGGSCATTYAHRLLPIVQAYAAGHYSADGCEAGPEPGEESTRIQSTRIVPLPDGAEEQF